ncbi:transcription-associated protein 1, partial [Nephila pilipes]
MNLLEEWYFHTPDVNLSFWKDIFDVRLCLLQRLCFCLSEIPSKDEASIWKMKCMAKSTYITTQMYLAKMYLLQGFSEECLNQLNHIKTSIMDVQILQLYMESILLAVKQHYKDKAKVKSLLDKASHFLKLKRQNLTNNKEEIMFIIYGKMISTLQIENDVAKNAFLQPYHNITGWSIGWIFCGKYFQNIYTTRNEKRALALAMECFVKACRYKNGSDNKELLSRILWIISYEDSSLSLSNTFISNGGEDIPISCWLPWIPQLLTTILRTSTCNLSFLLHAIGNKYPNSLFFLLHIFLKKIASKPKKRKLVKCFKQILSDLKIKYPGLCRSLKNISNEFLILSWNIHPDVHNILKKIESEICDILFQSVTKQTDVDIVSKITDVFLKRFSNMEEIRDENVEFIVKFIHR